MNGVVVMCTHSPMVLWCWWNSQDFTDHADRFTEISAAVMRAIST